ncbi:two-component sensor histidine kinase [Ramlibacter sp. AW1]|uniref:histidine kinase n=1 Tax=Ramlibacter aurantiacus TaxID=2801330 RepID=A0A936ZVJ9_9BURK|nr:ATP-binding protein [Ramlibacter aurantiacus]MBL0421364.1 two-component sensor histidine kinase [Ramlibacter aurantiacus]
MTPAARGGGRSIHWILLSSLVPLFVLVGAASAWIAYSSSSRMVHEYMDEQMRQLATSIASQPDPTPPMPPSLARAHERGSLVAVVIGPGRPASPALPPLPGEPGFHTLQDRGVPWRTYVTPAREVDGLQVSVLQSGAFRNSLAAGHTREVVLPVLVLLVAALLALWGVARRITRQVQEVAAQAARRDEEHLGELPLEQVPREIVPLVAAFNLLLGRLRDAFAIQPRFVQDAAHELRTPIAAIALQVENLQGDMPAGACTESLRHLQAGVRRAQRLVNQLLKLTRREADHPVPLTTVDLRDQASESISSLIALADQRRIDLGLVAPAGALPLPLTCNSDDLRSVLDNLIENALYYTPEGGVVDVRLFTLDGRAGFEVVDTGPGIPPALLERVFDRFVRLPGYGAHGSGLGLSIARGAAQRCGLRIVLGNRSDRTGLVARVEPL